MPYTPDGLWYSPKPRYQVLIGDGKPVGEPLDHGPQVLAQASEQTWLGHDVEVIASYDGFTTFWTYAKMSAKGIDRLL